jgi:hypothetical protein
MRELDGTIFQGRLVSILPGQEMRQRTGSAKQGMNESFLSHFLSFF